MSTLDFLGTLQTLIAERIQSSKEGSYTASLAAQGDIKVAKKVGEEATEVALSAVAESPARLKEETADLLYHLIVLLQLKGLSLENVVNELERRHKNN
tara:strand:- start:997 stop:1290 length:294 start_codon:yes stop_codon:yes gene_type:complete